MFGTKTIHRNHGFEEIIDIYIYIYIALFYVFFLKKSLVLSIALALPVLTGCASTQHTVRVSDNVPMNSSVNYSAVDYEETNHFFLGGLLQESSTDVANVCPAGKKPAKIVNETRWYQTLIGYLTLGIYTPRKTYVICG